MAILPERRFPLSRWIVSNYSDATFIVVSFYAYLDSARTSFIPRQILYTVYISLFVTYSVRSLDLEAFSSRSIFARVPRAEASDFDEVNEAKLTNGFV